MKSSQKPSCTMHYKHRSTPLHLKSENNSTSVPMGWFILNKNLILEKKMKSYFDINTSLMENMLLMDRGPTLKSGMQGNSW